MVRLRHPNVVLLLGACLYPSTMIITEVGGAERLGDARGDRGAVGMHDCQRS